MKKSRPKPFFRPTIRQEEYPTNERIRALEVRLIDENNEFISVLSTPEALAMAKEKGLDLVLVAPKAVPPVAKIIDYGKLQYEKEKKERKQRAHQKKIEVKGIRLSPRIGQHDLDIRINQSKKFLEEGNKVNIEIFLRGREKQFSNLARQMIEQFVQKINTELPVNIEQPLSQAGGKISMLIAKK